MYAHLYIDAVEQMKLNLYLMHYKSRPSRDEHRVANSSVKVAATKHVLFINY